MSKIVKRVTLPESIRAFTQHGIEMSSPQIIVIDKQTALSRNNALYGMFTSINYLLQTCVYVSTYLLFLVTDKIIKQVFCSLPYNFSSSAYRATHRDIVNVTLLSVMFKIIIDLVFQLIIFRGKM